MEIDKPENENANNEESVKNPTQQINANTISNNEKAETKSINNSQQKLYQKSNKNVNAANINKIVYDKNNHTVYDPVKNTTIQLKSPLMNVKFDPARNNEPPEMPTNEPPKTINDTPVIDNIPVNLPTLKKLDQNLNTEVDRFNHLSKNSILKKNKPITLTRKQRLNQKSVLNRDQVDVVPEHAGPITRKFIPREKNLNTSSTLSSLEKPVNVPLPSNKNDAAQDINNNINDNKNPLDPQVFANFDEIQQASGDSSPATPNPGNASQQSNLQNQQGYQNSTENLNSPVQNSWPNHNHNSQHLRQKLHQKHEQRKKNEQDKKEKGDANNSKVNKKNAKNQAMSMKEMLAFIEGEKLDSSETSSNKKKKKKKKGKSVDPIARTKNSDSINSSEKSIQNSRENSRSKERSGSQPPKPDKNNNNTSQNPEKDSKKISKLAIELVKKQSKKPNQDSNSGNSTPNLSASKKESKEVKFQNQKKVLKQKQVLNEQNLEKIFDPKSNSDSEISDDEVDSFKAFCKQVTSNAKFGGSVGNNKQRRREVSWTFE